jgi:hypothetical protein
MKIIHKGVSPDSKPVRFECTKCKTVFETDRVEAQRVYDQRDGDFWQHACPVCNHICTSAAK